MALSLPSNCQHHSAGRCLCLPVLHISLGKHSAPVGLAGDEEDEEDGFLAGFIDDATQAPPSTGGRWARRHSMGACSN